MDSNVLIGLLAVLTPLALVVILLVYLFFQLEKPEKKNTPSHRSPAHSRKRGGQIQ